MKIIGLTGGIAMGKTTAARMLRQMGLPVHDSDATVHRLYARGGGAVPLIQARFPDAVHQGMVDRALLGQQVLGNAAALKDLEAIMHPLVRRESHRWLRLMQRRRRWAVILDIPLLFEAGRAHEMDEIWVVDCPPFLQAQRALARPGMTPEKLAAILHRQYPQGERRRHATQVFQTGRGQAALRQELKATVAGLGEPGRSHRR